MKPLDQYTGRELPAVGLVGVGLLGSAVARRWLNTGLKVVAYDADPDRMQVIAADGAEAANTPQLVFDSCERVALALPHSGVSRQVLTEVTAATDRRVVLDMTTGDPEEMASIAAECETKGMIYLDTTVGGSSAEVAAGNAIVMAGGDAAAFESCRDLVGLFARRAFWLGPAGSGARMKLALNLVLGLNRAVLAEGLAFAESCGLDPAIALDIFRAGPAYSKVMDVKGEKMLRGDFNPQARLAQHRKDVDLILQQSARHLASTPFSELHRKLLLGVEQAGFGGEDNSSIIRAFRRNTSSPDRSDE